jgi:hypothetical protein
MNPVSEYRMELPESHWMTNGSPLPSDICAIVQIFSHCRLAIQSLVDIAVLKIPLLRCDNGYLRHGYNNKEPCW